MSDVEQISSNMRKDAFSLLNEWKLMSYLSKFGNSYIVGSLELDLMTWRDIDIEIVSESTPLKDDAIEIAGYIFKQDGVRKVTPIDYSDSDGFKKPKGLYVGVEYTDTQNNKWKVDVWLLTKDSARSKEKTDKIKSMLTPEYKEIILNIKNQLHDNPKYRKEITSVDIYEAVIENKINNLEEFKNYMFAKGISF